MEVVIRPIIKAMRKKDKSVLIIRFVRVGMLGALDE